MCNKLRKNDCKSPCRWIIGKGCKQGSAERKSPEVVRQQQNKKCSGLKKNDCTSPCRWVVGKGCKQGSSDKTASVPKNKVEWVALDVQISGTEQCIKDIVMKELLSLGRASAFYSILYKNKECLLKLVPLKKRGLPLKLIDPITRYTTEEDFQTEAKLAEYFSDQKLSPYFYESGICDINFYESERVFKAKMGYLIFDLFELKARDFIISAVKDIKDKSQSEMKRKIKYYLELFEKLDNSIDKDLSKANSLHITMTDVNVSNIMIKKVGSKYIAKLIDWEAAKIQPRTPVREDRYINERLLSNDFKASLQRLQRLGEIKFDVEQLF